MKKVIFGLSLLFSLSCFAQEQQPPSSPAAPEKLESGRLEVPRGKYITGGILGSAIGFGIGHAVQGRYRDKGWIFTATEATGLALVVGANCFRGRDTNSQDRAERERSDCENVSQGLIGAGLMIGFHIWEVVDLWVKTKPVSENTPTISILPTSEGPVLFLSKSF